MPSPARRSSTLAGHRSLVGLVSFNSDGTRLVTGGGDGTARVWDVSPEGGAEVRAAAYSWWIFATSRSHPTAPRWPRPGLNGWTWDAATLDRMHAMPDAHFGVAFAPDGSRLATASDCCEDSYVLVLDVDDGRGARSRSPGERSVAFGPDGPRSRPRPLKAPSPSCGSGERGTSGSAPSRSEAPNDIQGVRLPEGRIERGRGIQPRRLDARRPRWPRHRPRVAYRRPLAARQVAGQLRHRRALAWDPRGGVLVTGGADGAKYVGGSRPSMRSAPSPAAGS